MIFKMKANEKAFKRARDIKVLVILEPHTSAKIKCCHTGFPGTEIMEPDVRANF